MKRCFYLLMALFSVAFPLRAGIWDYVTNSFRGDSGRPSPTIRILIMHDVPGANLGVQGQYSLYDPYINKRLDTRFKGKCRYVQAIGCGLKWGEEFPDLHQFKIVDDKPDTVIYIGEKAYKGPVYVYDIPGGTVSIVNEIPVEQYVRVVLNAHYDEKPEDETLFALAIVARTNAYFQMQNPRNLKRLWAIDADTINYTGMIPDHDEIDRAVYSTRYMIMSRTGVYEGGATPFAAQFENLALGQSAKEVEVSKISIEEANEMAKKGAHAAQILARAFPGTTIMMMR